MQPLSPSMKSSTDVVMMQDCNYLPVPFRLAFELMLMFPFAYMCAVNWTMPRRSVLFVTPVVLHGIDVV